MKQILFLTLSSIISIAVLAQNTLSTDHRLRTQTLKLSSIPAMNANHARLWDLSSKQRGVIGSDFRSRLEIGTAAAERSIAGADFWFPIEPFKRTFGGVLKEIKIEDIDDPASSGSGFIDYDHNFVIIPTPDYQQDFIRSLDVAVKRMDGKDPLVDAGLEFEIKCDYDDFKLHRQQDMELEIDLHKSNINSMINHNKPVIIREKDLTPRADTIFAYGPWVSDAGHCFKPEIHPAEQVWWKRQLNPSQEQFFLLLSCDESDRYCDSSNFDSDEYVGPDRYLKNIWAPRPLRGTFAILFAVNSGKEYAQYDIEKLGSQNVPDRSSLSYNHYYLVNNGDTLIRINYPSTEKNLVISFENIFAGVGGWQDQKEMVYGFITLESTVGKKKNTVLGSSEGGYLFLRINKTVKPIVKKPSFSTKPITH